MFRIVTEGLEKGKKLAHNEKCSSLPGVGGLWQGFSDVKIRTQISY